MKFYNVSKEHFQQAFDCLFTGKHLFFINEDNHLSFYYYYKRKNELIEIHCTCKNESYSCQFIARNHLIIFDDSDGIISLERLSDLIAREYKKL